MHSSLRAKDVQQHPKNPIPTIAAHIETEPNPQPNPSGQAKQSAAIVSELQNLAALSEPSPSSALDQA
jgi:hypothetical protein